MKKEKSHITKLFIFNAALFISLFVVFFTHFAYKTNNKMGDTTMAYEQGWSYYNGEEYVPIKSIPDNLEWNEDRELKIKNILPVIRDSNNTLLFRSSNQTVRVYVDGMIIYSFGMEEKSVFGRTPGSNWNFVVIPEEYSGKQIEIVLQSGYKDCAGFISTFKLGQYNHLMKEFLTERIFPCLISISILIYGFILVAARFFIKKYAVRTSGYAYLGMFGILISIWSILETQLIPLVYTHTGVLTLITFYALMLMPISFNSFVEEMYYEGRSKIHKILNLIGYGNLVVQTILQVLNIIDVYEMVLVTHILLFVTMAVNIIMAIFRYKKYHETVMKHLTMAFLVFVFFGMIDVIRYYTGSFGDYAKFFRVGLFFFIIILSVLYTKKMMEIMRKGIKAELFEKLAYEDSLTKCKSRAFFEKEIKEIDMYHNKDGRVAIVTFDINNLKENNDTYGHSEGDKMIVKCAYCIQSAFKGFGELSRIGGDEFALVMREGVSQEIIESAIKIMGEKVKYHGTVDGKEIGIAYGYAIYDSNIDKNMESLLSRADALMYKKKKEMKSEIL